MGRPILKGILVFCGLVLCLLLTFCAWVGGVPGTLALQSVPVLPGANMRIDQRGLFSSVGDNGVTAEMIYDVERPWPEVVDFYQQEMGKRGWKLDKLTKYESKYVDVCMVFRRAPGFVVSVETIGDIENNTNRAKTAIKVEAIMREYMSCK